MGPVDSKTTTIDKSDRTTATVLVIHRDRTICELIRTVLEDEGYRSLACEDPATAEERAFSESPDLIVLDWSRALSQAEQLYDRFRTDPRTARTPILVCTDESDPGVYARDIAGRGDVLLPAPFDIDDLAHKARLLIGSV
jgi:DNA-binding response OmpR family regulator